MISKESIINLIIWNPSCDKKYVANVVCHVIVKPDDCWIFIKDKQPGFGFHSETLFSAYVMKNRFAYNTGIKSVYFNFHSEIYCHISTIHDRLLDFNL